MAGWWVTAPLAQTCSIFKAGWPGRTGQLSLATEIAASAVKSDSVVGVRRLSLASTQVCLLFQCMRRVSGIVLPHTQPACVQGLHRLYEDCPGDDRLCDCCLCDDRLCYERCDTGSAILGG